MAFTLQNVDTTQLDWGNAQEIILAKQVFGADAINALWPQSNQGRNTPFLPITPQVAIRVQDILAESAPIAPGEGDPGTGTTTLQEIYDQADFLGLSRAEMIQLIMDAGLVLDAGQADNFITEQFGAGALPWELSGAGAGTGAGAGAPIPRVGEFPPIGSDPSGDIAGLVSGVAGAGTGAQPPQFTPDRPSLGVQFGQFLAGQPFGEISAPFQESFNRLFPGAEASFLTRGIPQGAAFGQFGGAGEQEFLPFLQGGGGFNDPAIIANRLRTISGFFGSGGQQPSGGALNTGQQAAFDVFNPLVNPATANPAAFRAAVNPFLQRLAPQFRSGFQRQFQNEFDVFQGQNVGQAFLPQLFDPSTAFGRFIPGFGG